MKRALCLLGLVSGLAVAGDLDKAYNDKFFFDSVGFESAPGIRNLKGASGIVVKPDGTIASVLQFVETTNQGVSATSQAAILADQLGDWKVLAQGQTIFGDWSVPALEPTRAIRTVSVFNPWKYVEVWARFEPAAGYEIWTAPGAWFRMGPPVKLYYHPDHPTGAFIRHDTQSVAVPWGSYIYGAPVNDGARVISNYPGFATAWRNGHVQLRVTVYRTEAYGPLQQAIGLASG